MLVHWRETAHRVTKYNPAFRNEAGHYSLDEWTDYTEIGKSFNGVMLTQAAYLKVETAYIDAACLFLGSAPGNDVYVTTVEKNYAEDLNGEMLAFYDKIIEGSIFDKNELDKIITLILRGNLWCEIFNASDPDFALRFGYDYYMYFNASTLPQHLITTIEGMGLFVE